MYVLLNHAVVYFMKQNVLHFAFVNENKRAKINLIKFYSILYFFIYIY